MEEKIKEVIDSIKPYLNTHGGDIDFIEYKDKVVYVKVLGACTHCAHQAETIKGGILEALKSEIPEIEDVINVDL